MDKALELNPASSFARFTLGVMAQSERRLDRARAEFDKAVTANPQFGKAYLRRGQVLH